VAETIPTEDGDILRIQNAQERDVPAQVILPEVLLKQPLPTWYHKEVSAEAMPTIKPSGEGGQEYPEEAKGDLAMMGELSARERGIIIHKLLEHLFAMSDTQRREKGLSFLRAKGMSTDLTEDLLKEVLGLLANLSIQQYFTPTSFAEVAVMGIIDKKLYKGYIDRLVVDHAKQHIYIVDFKSGDMPVTVSDQYQQQLLIYKQLVQPTYPEYTITGVLLWTKTGVVQVVDFS
jgi:ATP-dependent exoDNAse (exonuclease V) beta subunit